MNEPWRIKQRDEWPFTTRVVDSYGQLVANQPDCVSTITRTVEEHNSHPANVKQRAKMERAVACVNACAGFPDPASLVDQRNRLLELLKRFTGCAIAGGRDWNEESLYAVYREAQRAIRDNSAIALCEPREGSDG